MKFKLFFSKIKRLFIKKTNDHEENIFIFNYFFIYSYNYYKTLKEGNSSHKILKIKQGKYKRTKI